MNSLIELAENLIESYTQQRLNEAIHRQKRCGCRSCSARARAWTDWAAGDDDALYETLRVPSKWDYMAP